MSNTTRIPERKEAMLFLGSALVCWLYVIARALWMPLVHDEANSFFHFIHSGSFLPFSAKWDAANHVLVMAMGKLAYRLFGPNAFALRSFAILCYPLLAWSSWRLGSRVREPLVRWCLWAAMLATPFLLEFFSLFRGYGPSFAFMLWAIAMGLEFWDGGRTRSFVAAVLALGLGVSANLSLLPIWSIGMVLLALAIRKAEPTLSSEPQALSIVRLLALLGLGITPGLYMITFAMGLRERGLLYYGSDRGLLAGSFASLRERLFPMLSDPAGIGICIALALIILGAFVLVLAKREQQRYSLLVLVTLLLGLEFLARWVLGELFGVLYPKDRAMLHFIPLLLLAFATALDRLSRNARSFGYLALPLLLLPAYTIATADPSRSTQWPEESISKRIYNFIQARQAVSEEGLLVTGASPLTVIWDHQLLCGTRAFATLYPSDTLLPWADLLLVDARKAEAWQGRSKLLLGPNDSGQWLLEPLQKHTRQLLWDSVRHVQTTNKEFTELYAQILDVSDTEGMLVDFSAERSSHGERRGEVMLVVQVDASDGSQAYYHAQRLDRQWNDHRSQEIRSVVAVPRIMEKGDRLVVYIWNPDGHELEWSDVRIRINAIKSDTDRVYKPLPEQP